MVQQQRPDPRRIEAVRRRPAPGAPGVASAAGVDEGVLGPAVEQVHVAVVVVGQADPELPAGDEVDALGEPHSIMRAW
jgi:hypothetical protein